MGWILSNQSANLFTTSYSYISQDYNSLQTLLPSLVLHLDGELVLSILMTSDVLAMKALCLIVHLLPNTTATTLKMLESDVYLMVSTTNLFLSCRISVLFYLQCVLKIVYVW